MKCRRGGCAPNNKLSKLAGPKIEKRTSISSHKRHEKLKMRIKQLKQEMAEISVQQKSIRERQRDVREKFEEIEAECAQLREGAELISQQGRCMQRRLNLMLKARQDKVFVKLTSKCLLENLVVNVVSASLLLLGRMFTRVSER